nr:hypothetical protein CFP56_71844 [Quercus suber]
MLEPSQYALGGLNFVPYKAKQIPKYRVAKSYVEAIKAPVQARPKPVQQPFIKEKVKDGVVKNILELSSDNTQVVVFENQAGNFPQATMGGGEGEEGGINGKTIIKEKISEGNNLNIPLKFNLNSNIAEFGKLHDNRKSCWLGRGLIMEVNELGKRRVSWDGVRDGGSELTATKNLESSMVLPTTDVQLAMSPKGTLATISPLALTEVAGKGDRTSPNRLA